MFGIGADATSVCWTTEHLELSMNDTNYLHPIKNLPSKLGIGRSKIYEELASGRLRSVRVGRRRLVTDSALTDYIAGLMDAAEADPSEVME
jgi:excisionase family DNA binding protein